jgi:glycosyltransferase involved in cell wall biosynthesis
MVEKNITYVFGVGRKNIINNHNYSDEFFYGYQYFQNDYESVNFIEFVPYLNKKYIFFEKVLSRLTNLPFYFSNIMSSHNYKILKKTDYIVFTNERMLISCILYLILLKKRKIKSVVMIMGLFSKKTNNRFKNLLQKFFLSFVLTKVNEVIFLGIGEYNAAKEQYPKYEKKFHHIPFMLNNDFWINKKDVQIESRDNILFIGNDGKRDYHKVIQIAKALPEYNFIFVSKIILDEDIISDNVQLINGYWNENVLDDLDMQKIYDKCRITILPLIQSEQPSGQSVTLQSLSRGVPVMISRTNGFWDNSKFINDQNIIFVDNNSLEGWTSGIKDLYQNIEKLDLLSTSGIKLMDESDSSEVFYRRLKNLLF